MSFELQGKTILITGGAGFLGSYFVNALSKAGSHVIIAERSESVSAAQGLADEVKQASGNEVTVIEMDVRDQSQVDAAFESLEKIDVVVNNAAIDPKFDPNAAKNDRSFENYPEEAMRESTEVNMLGSWHVAKAAVRKMLSQGSGNIIQVSSIYGMTVPHQDIYPEGTQKPVDYGMTKAAVQYMTRYIAGTYGRQGIRANALVLGGVFKGHDEEFMKKYGQYTMLGRMTDPHEIGEPLVFLASDASSGMTGHLMAVDAGWSGW